MSQEVDTSTCGIRLWLTASESCVGGSWLQGKHMPSSSVHKKTLELFISWSTHLFSSPFGWSHIVFNMGTLLTFTWAFNGAEI